MILNAVERGPGAAPADALPLVLLHGLFGRAANFGVAQHRLAEHRRVVALDLRNHGASPHAPDMDYPAMAADVAETLTAMGAAPCVLVGHSMGGKVAMRLALDRPEAVTRLLVADIAPVAYPPHFQGFVAAMRALPLTPSLTRAQASAALAGPIADERVRGFLLQNLRTGPQLGWALNLDAIAGALDAIGAWPEDGAAYDGPTLFMSGERSDYIRPEHRPVIRAQFPAARFVTLRDAGHWLHADNPAGFLDVVDGFAR